MRGSIRLLTTAVIGVIAVFLHGCASGPPAVLSGDVQPSKKADETYHLATLDKVEIQLHDGAHLESRVEADGHLRLGSAIDLVVVGLPLPQVNSKLRVLNPQIDKIDWTEFRENSVSVIGEVYNQTKVDLGESPFRVLDAIAAAGGFTPLADEDHIILVRRNAGQTLVFSLNLSAAMKGLSPQYNILVQSGDVITVRRTLL